MISVIISGIRKRRKAGRKDQPRVVQLAMTPDGETVPHIVPAISSPASSGLAGKVSIGKVFIAFGASVMSLGVKIVGAGVALWLGLGVVRWLFGNAAAQLSAVARGGPEIAKTAEAVTS